ncbi:MAG: hypothetical protein AAF492_09580, partial [Verrucomicrobiota bacterium]
MKLFQYSFLFILISISCLRADPVKVGEGAYRTDLPPDSNDKPRRSVKASPLVSERVAEPIPTSDWWSSLVWPMHSPYSMPMFPHPLAVQAHEDGLGVGYTHEPSISNHEHKGKVFQRGTGYRYPYRESIRVGLKGFTSDDARLDGFSDWAVTALWEQGEDRMRATFAHGSPFVYFEKKSKRPWQLQFKAAKVNPHQEPIAPFVHEWSGIDAAHNGKPGEVELTINAGKHVGLGSKARLVYDFDGDGQTDRVETFQLFATDPVASSWETYSSKKKSVDAGLTRGEMKDFKNGSVRLEFWKCFG